MKLLREPLLHFLVIGAALFGLYHLAGSGDEPAAGEITVGASQIASMKAIFSRTWQREPTVEEVEALVADYIRDEVFYREGVAMGLDQDDAVVRRRVRQKMEFIADLASDVEPTEAELKAFVADHRERFRAEPRFSFSQAYFGANPGDAELERLLQALNAGTTDASEIGDPFIAGTDFRNLTRSGVAQAFGETFAAWFDRPGSDGWEGPVTSSYGVHLVRVSERIESRERPFGEIREAARREWLHAHKLAANDALYETLRTRYVIKIEDVPSGAGGQTLAEATP